MSAINYSYITILIRQKNVLWIAYFLDCQRVLFFSITSDNLFKTLVCYPM